MDGLVLYRCDYCNKPVAGTLDEVPPNCPHCGEMACYSLDHLSEEAKLKLALDILFGKYK